MIQKTHFCGDCRMRLLFQQLSKLTAYAISAILGTFDCLGIRFRLIRNEGWLCREVLMAWLKPYFFFWRNSSMDLCPWAKTSTICSSRFNALFVVLQKKKASPVPLIARCSFLEKFLFIWIRRQKLLYILDLILVVNNTLTCSR